MNKFYIHILTHYHCANEKLTTMGHKHLLGTGALSRSRGNGYEKRLWFVEMFKQFFAEADLTLPQFRSSYKDSSMVHEHVNYEHRRIHTNSWFFHYPLVNITLCSAMLGVCFEPWRYEKEANQGKSTKEDSFLPDLKPMYLWESRDWKLETLTFCSRDVSLGLWWLPETFKENKCLDF